MFGKKRRNYEIDMVNGPLTAKLIRFAIPVALSGILQLLFNTADVIIVGRFSGKTSLAAVGSTGSLINLLISLFMGLSVGTNVLVARYYGGGDKKSVSKVVHTSIFIGFAGGIFLAVLGLTSARPLLYLMGTPTDVIDQSVLYMKILFLGLPASMLFNFGAAILRGVGDVRRPLNYLTVAGLINVFLNLILVTVFHLGVAGVAIATIVSQYISCALTLVCLKNEMTAIKLFLKKIRIHKNQFVKIMRIGIPAGLQGIIFSFSNVLIQSSVNSFGSTVMAGSTAASNLEGFVYVSMSSIYQTSLSFTSQNFGARNYVRIRQILKKCLILVTVTGLFFGGSAYLLGEWLIGIYNNDPDVISYGIKRLGIIGLPYFLCGLMEVVVGSLRGIGYQIMPMMISLAGACGFRILWIVFVFPHYRDFSVLLYSYPISWTLTFLTHLLCYAIVSKKTLLSHEIKDCHS